MSSPVDTSDADGVRTIRLDAGKMNVLTVDAVRALRAAIDDAGKQPGIGAVLLEGRSDAFCAGLDLATLATGGDEANALLIEMGDLLYTLYSGTLRVVSACAGHAVAAGAMLLLVSNVRIGAEGKYRLGFSEVGRGMPLPELPVLLARDRLDPRHLQSATMLGRLFSPAEGLDAGFLDEIVPAAHLHTVATERARALAALDQAAYGKTLATVRGPSLERMAASLEETRTRLTRPPEPS